MGLLNVRALTVASELRRGSMVGDVKRVILICEECGERLVLGGPPSKLARLATPCKVNLPQANASSGSPAPP